ncbi:uncharacterized protein LOC113272598 [Papaver somniferum]|uniref:uncharacterized protein LOC113272598 n=1 Tax=Papaver somniferum TaxID=3469 RepID=UPI000E704D9B|nr:uncharacterized protein LOC113272598 [Papaver somniferum]
MSCVTSPTFPILLNGAPYGSFKSGRGLRQGYPLSPALFIICYQGLSLLMENLELNGLYSGYRINVQSSSISHLMFADDLFFFGKNSDSIADHLKYMLDTYASFSGQIINFMKSSIHFSKGSGNNIRIWHDPWIPGIPGFRPSKLSNSTVDVTRVSDLINHEDKSWNLELLSQVFPQDQVATILNIYIPLDTEIEDKLIWLKTPSGVFFLKFVYKLLMDNTPTSSSEAEFPCKLFWKKIKIQPKIQIFIWKVLHEGLAVYHNLSKFNNQITSACPLCNYEEETIFHLLFECQFSVAVLQESPILIEVLAGSSLRQIIQHWLLYTDQGIMLNLGSCILWNIRKMRNDLVFNNSQPSASQCIQKALQDFKIFDLHNALNCCTNIAVNENNATLWEPPPNCVIKVNVDAAFNHGDAAAAVARDSFGNQQWYNLF